MQALEFPTQVKDGRIPRPVAEQLAACFSGFEGKRILITVKEQKKTRSHNQNRFYQGPFIEAIRLHLLEHGHRVSHDDIHAGLREAHAKNAYTIMIGDVPFRVPPSTARLGTVDFELFLEEIRAEFAARFAWQLPFPGENA